MPTPLTAERVRRAKDLAPRGMKDLANTVTRQYALRTERWRPYPDFLIVGTKRGGTTSLWNYLLQHPQVLPMFPAARGRKANAWFFEHQEESDAWYRSHFHTRMYRRLRARSVGRVVTGEASPYYMYGPSIPARIAQIIPDVRLVVMLRNPVDRAYGHFQERVKEGVETLSFRDALTAESHRLAGEYERMGADPNYYSVPHDYFTYRDRGVYLPQVQRLHEHFPPSHVLILRSEDLYLEPQRVYDDVSGFLELERHTLAAPKQHNRIARAPLSEDIREELAKYYAPHNAALYDYLGRDFGWH